MSILFNLSTISLASDFGLYISFIFPSGLEMLRLIRSVVLALLFVQSVGADEWPQWRGPNRDGVWKEAGLIDKFSSKRIQLKWKVPIKSGYSGPTVAAGRVFVSDRFVEPKQQERILCFDWKTGNKIWSHTYPCRYSKIGYLAGPRACITVHAGLTYCLGAMGHLHCINAKTGKIAWKRNLLRDFKIQLQYWGIACAPLIYKNLVILQIGGTPDACVVALDRLTGTEVWRALKDRACYSAPVLVRQAGKDVVICWTGDSVAGIDAGNGKVYWRHAFRPKNMPIGIATPVINNNRVFVTSFYDGSLMLRLMKNAPEVEQIWKRVGPSEKNTDALQSIMSTPVFRDEFIYGVCSYGELRCLKAGNGDRVWENRTATKRDRWSNIHMVQNRDRVWMFNEAGELIISKLGPAGFKEISRAKLIDPTKEQLRRRNGVCWSHPAFAYKHVFIRNDKELVCASLAK